MMRILLKASLILTLGALSLPALAEDVSGVVRVVGSAYTAKTILTPDNEFKGPAICKGSIAKRVGRLAGMTVKVTGAWQTNKDGEKTCIDATDFSVEKMSNGRRPLVGTLEQTSGIFQVKTADGNVHRLHDPSPGLKELKGKKVIIDINSMNAPGSKDVTNRVVSYSEFPE